MRAHDTPAHFTHAFDLVNYTARRYTHYGYYNNFFAVKLSLYQRPEVRPLNECPSLPTIESPSLSQ